MEKLGMYKELKNILLCVLAILAVLQLCGCEPNSDEDSVPPAVVLQLTVKNDTAAPVSLSIRHRYLLYSKTVNSVVPVERSDWSEEIEVQPGESKEMGNETVSYTWQGASHEAAGFVLLDNAVNKKMSHHGCSSFEVKIRTEDGASEYLAGYNVEYNKYLENGTFCADTYTVEDGVEFTGTELCDLQIETYQITGREAVLESQFFPDRELWGVKAPDPIPFTITLNADGTYSFDFPSLSGNPSS